MPETITDLEKMMAEAVDASEDTGEGNVAAGELTKPAQSQPRKPEPRVQQAPPVQATQPVQPTQQRSTQQKPAQQSEPRVQQAPPVQPTQSVQQTQSHQQTQNSNPQSQKHQEEPKKERTRAIAPLSQGNAGVITEDSILKILKMNSKFDKFDERQKSFVSGYFSDQDSVDISTVIYEALTASQRDLDALENIVKARANGPAERAFFLMSLDNSEISDIYEQIELLTAELGTSTITVNELNKLDICRKIEHIISKMQKDMFSYIEKLQEFTDIALD